MALHYLYLQPNVALQARFSGPFRAVVIAEQEVDEDWRKVVAEWLVGSGCLYAVAWGVDCEKWHNSIDWAVLESFDYGNIPDDRFVMTTWHANEPMSEAFWFAENCATHPHVVLAETYIIHVAEAASMQRMLGAYADSQTEDSGN